MYSELLNKLEAIYSNGDLDNATKVEELFRYFTEVVLEELKTVHRQAVSLKL